MKIIFILLSFFCYGQRLKLKLIDTIFIKFKCSKQTDKITSKENYIDDGYIFKYKTSEGFDASIFFATSKDTKGKKQPISKPFYKSKLHFLKKKKNIIDINYYIKNPLTYYDYQDKIITFCIIDLDESTKTKYKIVEVRQVEIID